MEYARIIAWAAEQPWALRPRTLAIMRDVLIRRSAGGRLSADELHARVGERGPRVADLRYYEPDGDETYAPRWDIEGNPLGYRSETSGAPMPKGKQVVAIIGVYGIISQRANLLDDVSGPGSCSIEQLTTRFRSALSDNAVRSIVFDVDSPGGGVYGVQELAAEILDARGQKPCFAVASSLAASAAYWLFCSVDPGNAAVTPSGEVGSIGVYSAHQDISGMLEQDGVKMTLVSAGKYKTEGNPFEPLDDDARAYMQSRVNDYYGAFVRHVAKARGVSPDDVRKGFGQGRVVGSDDAVAQGMADRAATFDETVRRAAGRSSATPMRAASASAPAQASQPREMIAAERQEIEALIERRRLML